MTIWGVVRNLLRHPIRSGLVILGLAVSAALLLDMTMLSGGMERSFRDMLLGRGFQIRLSPKGTMPFDTEATIARITPILDAIRRDPAVAAAGPVVGAPVHARVRDTLRTMVGYGIDPAGQGLYQLDRGVDLDPRDTTGLLISQSVASKTGWRIGDTVLVQGRLDPQSARAEVERSMVIRGVVTWSYDSKDQLSIGANYRVIQRLGRFPDDDVASMVMVKVRDGEDVEAVASRIAAAHPAVQVNSVAALVAQFRTRMAYFHQLSLILATISLVVGGLLVGTILTITVNERIGEIVVLRAIGVGRPRIIRMVMLEGGILTLAGLVGGIALGLVTARQLDAILTSFPGLPAVISFFVPEARAMTRAAAVVVATGILAAGYPAWLAARAPIAETLRAEAE